MSLLEEKFQEYLQALRPIVPNTILEDMMRDTFYVAIRIALDMPVSIVLIELDEYLEKLEKEIAVAVLKKRSNLRLIKTEKEPCHDETA
jgi:hypothetical protein